MDVPSVPAATNPRTKPEIFINQSTERLNQNICDEIYCDTSHSGRRHTGIYLTRTEVSSALSQRVSRKTGKNFFFSLKINKKQTKNRF